MSQQCAFTEVSFSHIVCYMSKLADQEKQFSVSLWLLWDCISAEYCVPFGAPVYRKAIHRLSREHAMALQYVAYNDWLKAGFVQLGEEWSDFSLHLPNELIEKLKPNSSQMWTEKEKRKKRETNKQKPKPKTKPTATKKTHNKKHCKQPAVRDS